MKQTIVLLPRQTDGRLLCVCVHVVVPHALADRTLLATIYILRIILFGMELDSWNTHITLHYIHPHALLNKIRTTT
jgi:hypothetical protein